MQPATSIGVAIGSLAMMPSKQAARMAFDRRSRSRINNLRGSTTAPRCAAPKKGGNPQGAALRQMRGCISFKEKKEI